MWCLLRRAFFLPVALSAGCAVPVASTFEGERDASQIAILKGGETGPLTSRFASYSADGAEPKPFDTTGNPSQARILPGRYRVAVRCSAGDRYGYPIVAAEFRAGMTYEIFCELPHDQVSKVRAYISQAYPTAEFNEPPRLPERKGIAASFATPVAALRTYKPAGDLTPKTAASIRGTRTPMTFPVVDQFAWILSVDGRLVPGGAEAYSQPILVPPGPVELRVAWWQGVGFLQEPVRVQLEPGGEYILRHDKTDRGVTLWLEDAKTQAKVGREIFLKRQPAFGIFWH